MFMSDDVLKLIELLTCHAIIAVHSSRTNELNKDFKVFSANFLYI